MSASRKYNHVPKAEWTPCAGCGRRVEWGGQLPDGMCAACNDPATREACREINRQEARLAGVDRPYSNNERLMQWEREALRRYAAWAEGAPLPSPEAVRMMVDRPSADSGKRGGGPNTAGG